jgi:hypothetical protein
MNSYLASEKTKVVPIEQKPPTFMEDEYSLKENVFDPSKCSPPNDFLAKLELRMNLYNVTNNILNNYNK